MTKSKNLFKNISIFLCLVPMLVLSLFCLVPNKQDLKVAAADTSLEPYTFIGSSMNLCASTVDNIEGDHDVTTFINVNITFGFTNNDFSWNVRGTLARPALDSVRTFNNGSSIGSMSDLPSASSGVVYHNSLPTLENTRYYFFYYVKFSAKNKLPSSDIVKVEVGSFSTLPVTNYPKYCCNYITYYDSKGDYISFMFARYAPNYGTSSDVFGAFDFEERTYYLNLLDLGDGSVYELGYTDGYNDGLTEGKDAGYTDGYQAGVDIGYGNGYNDGVEHGGNYTFLGLIGAVIDAPVSAFTSLLNFDILGVNILGFISGLLTLALIIFIIKLCLGGK